MRTRSHQTARLARYGKAMFTRFSLSLVLATGLLSGCGVPLPNGINLEISGQYTGKVIGKDGQSLYDVTLVTNKLNVTATFRNQATGNEFTLTGQRSIQGATPVQVSATGGIGTGSACPGGFTDMFTLGVSFYASRGGNGLGNLWHESCDALGQGFVANLNGAGLLELTKK